jgi:hypothetical protein
MGERRWNLRNVLGQKSKTKEGYPMRRNISFVGLIGFAVVLLLLVPNAQSDEGVLDVFGVGEHYSSGQPGVDELTSYQPQQANAAVMPLDQEPWGVYENWSKPTIRSDRWLVRTGFAHEARREVKDGNLLMRFRLEGATSSNDGFTPAMQVFRMLNRSAVNAIKVKFLVKNYTVVGCEENNQMTRIRPAAITLSKFNDGSSKGSNDQTGDHFVRIMVNREAFTSDPQGKMTVQAFLFRCTDSICSYALGSVADLNMGQVKVGEEFSLRIVWDEPNSRVLVGYNNNPDVILEYPPYLNQGPAVVTFADFHTMLVNANCEEGPTINDTEIKVLKVSTNASAIIP